VLPTASAAASATVATASAATTAIAAAATTTVAAAATAVTTTTATVASTTAAASPTAVTASAATTWRTSFARACFVYGQWPTVHSLSVELGDGLLGILLGGHRHEGEAARFAGKLILHQRDLLDWSRLSEKILKIGFGRVEGKVSYV
jgi:hypothetical protein